MNTPDESSNPAEHKHLPPPEGRLIQSFVRHFYRDLVDSLTEPRRFFAERYPHLSFNYALAFGLTVGWTGEGLKWAVRMINHETLMDGFLKIRDQLMQLPIWKDLPTSMWVQNPTEIQSLFPAWIAEAATVALFPFSFLIKIVISSVALAVGGFFFIGNRSKSHQESQLLGGGPAMVSDPSDLTHWMKLVAATSGPLMLSAILSFLPLGLGNMVGFLYGLAILLIAISIRYRISMLRGFAVLTAPWLALLMIGGCFIAFFGAMIFAFIAAIVA